MKTTTRLAFALRLAATIAFLAVIGLWAATGAHTGWTQTSKVVLQHDEITGIDFPVRQKTFVAGVEILAVGTGFAAVLAVASLLGNRRRAIVRA